MTAFACTKIPHPTEWEAARHAVRVAKKGTTGARLNVYRCPHCSTFHWGHDRSSHRRIARAFAESAAPRDDFVARNHAVLSELDPADKRVLWQLMQDQSA